MFDIGGPELIMILIGVLILFGPKKLPELAQGLGKGLRQFRRAQQEFNDQITSAMREEERKKNDEWKRPIDPKTVSRGTEPRETPGASLPNGSTTDDFTVEEDPGYIENRISPSPAPSGPTATDDENSTPAKPTSSEVSTSPPAADDQSREMSGEEPPAKGESG
jgi:sec-independent protein translocase protein TatA